MKRKEGKGSGVRIEEKMEERGEVEEDSYDEKIKIG